MSRLFLLHVWSAFFRRRGADLPWPVLTMFGASAGAVVTFRAYALLRRRYRHHLSHRGRIRVRRSGFLWSAARAKTRRAQCSGWSSFFFLSPTQTTWSIHKHVELQSAATTEHARRVSPPYGPPLQAAAGQPPLGGGASSHPAHQAKAQPAQNFRFFRNAGTSTVVNPPP